MTLQAWALVLGCCRNACWPYMRPVPISHYNKHKPFGHRPVSLAKGMQASIVHVESFIWLMSSPNKRVAVRLTSDGVIVRLNNIQEAGSA